jgi:DNA helicase-4
LAKSIEPSPSASQSLTEDALSNWPQASAVDRFLYKAHAPNFVKEIWARHHYKAIFDSFQAYPMTKSQRKASVSFSRETLVVAGAGSGKTALLLARAKYLLQSKRSGIGEVLLISFNKDAVDEILVRSKELNLKIVARTFNALGNDIANSGKNKKPVLFTSKGDTEKFLERALNSEISSESRAELAKYFSSEMVPFKRYDDFDDLSEYVAYVRGSIPTTLQNERVKSHGEWMIANYLFCNNIAYKYEEVYRAGTEEDFHQPDFTVQTVSGKSIFIEYFGIDKYGNTAPGIDSKAYNASITWKRAVHKRNNTKLIQLTFEDLKNRTLLSKLRKDLLSLNVVFKPKTYEEVLSRANSLGYQSRFLATSKAFLERARANNDNTSKLFLKAGNDPRSVSFLRVFETLRSRYEEELQNQGGIDFADQIHLAIVALKNPDVPFTHNQLLVDEFQDISKDRMALLRAIRAKKPDLEITYVGDDWQAINRFAGSDVDIMKQLSKRNADRKVIALSETFRLPQSLANFSSRFISKNALQIKKRIIGRPDQDRSSLFIHWDTSQNEPFNNLKHVIKRIGPDSSDPSKKLQILARYSHNKPEVFLIKPFWAGPIEIRTIHSAKGLEADYVIVMDVVQDYFGFPSTIEDDPVLALVKPSEESFEFAEERRVFYVALTRAKIACHLISPIELPSLFTTELLKDRVGKHLGLDDSKNRVCPLCNSGRLYTASNGSGKFCSNTPLCSFRAPTCSECLKAVEVVAVRPIKYECEEHPRNVYRKCPSCSWGVLVDVPKRDGSGVFQSCHSWSTTKCVGPNRWAQKTKGRNS